MNSRQKFLPRSPESLERDLDLKRDLFFCFQKVQGWQGRFFEIFIQCFFGEIDDPI